MSTKANDVTCQIRDFYTERVKDGNTFPSIIATEFEEPNRDGPYTLWLFAEFCGIKVTVERCEHEDLWQADNRVNQS